MLPCPALLEKRLAAYAVSAGVALAIAPSTGAQVVYTDVEPDVCLNFASHQIDLDGDGARDFRITQNSIFAPLNSGGGSSHNYGDIKGVFFPDNRFMATSNSPYARALASGATISSAQNFDTQIIPPYFYNWALFWVLDPDSSSAGNWLGGNDAFVGLRFVADRAGASTTHFGWTRVSSSDDGNMVCVHEFAYEATPNAAIDAGDRGSNTAITCTPVGDPTIPASGGDFTYNIEVANNGPTAQDVDVWIDIDGPGVNRTAGPITRTLPAETSLQHTLNQRIPGSAPAGDYTQTCNVGTFPNAQASSSFSFEKTEAFAPDNVSVAEWTAEAEIAVALANEASVEAAGTHELSAAYPNPFNPTSRFTLAVARDQRVTAELYNVLGQRVATLFDGSVEASAAQIVQIDGSDLSSGTYVVRVNGETISDAIRVTLTK